MTFKQDILEVAGDEAIQAIVISTDRQGWGCGDKVPPADANRVLTWDEAAPLLDYGYYAGYGCQDCHSIYAWTATRVLLVVEYDGSTHVASVPRHPIDCEPVSA